jgi:hypothetical protein
VPWHFLRGEDARVDGARRPTLAQAGVRLVALMLLLTCLLNVAMSPSSTALAAVCAGDEQILLAPEAPHVGSSLMVAAMSGFPHTQRRDQIRSSADFGAG